MPEGGDIAALSEALGSWTQGKLITLRVNGIERVGWGAGAVSVGKQFCLNFIDRDSNEDVTFSGHLGLSGSAWIRTCDAARSDSGWKELVTHKGPKGSTIATLSWKLENERAATTIEIGFRNGTGSRFALEPFEAVLGAMDLVQTDLSSLESKWLTICSESPKRSVESLLTDQKLIAGAGKRLRAEAFERCDLSGKEKSGTLSRELLKTLIAELQQAAIRERNCRFESLNGVFQQLASNQQ